MKITHIMLSNFYVEGLGYQENLLPIYHKKLGYEVSIVTSVFSNSYLGDSRYINCDEYINDFGIKVTKLRRKKRLIFGKDVSFNSYYNVFESLINENPDIIFIHGLLAFANIDIIKFLKRRPNVIAYADQHGDYYNGPYKTLKQKFIIKVIWNPKIRPLIKYVSKFWGTTPWRCDYLERVYKIPKNKISFLTMGADVDRIDFDNKEIIRKKIREQYNINQSDFLIISGGKIDSTKNIHKLMAAFSKLKFDYIKLLVFGNCTADMEKIINDFKNDKRIIYIGWIDSSKVYDLFLSSDLAVFPGTHSVLWEQACGCGLPAIFKKWIGMQHVYRNGNCQLIDGDSIECIKESIKLLLLDNEKYNEMKRIADIEKKYFSYYDIALRSIEKE